MRLKPSHQVFVDHYLRTGNASASAKMAGYSEKTSRHCGYQLLKHPTIAAALKEARDGAKIAASYTLDAAMKETDEAIEFAKLTKNANAMVKAIEHKSKLNGLLIERHEVKTAGFMISITGIDAVAALPELNKQALIPSPTVSQEVPTLAEIEGETDE